ncbi:uncharacterized protein LOC124255345 [Haliotis rubra]|uniref:uncharacterized protein LOC124255345 n=1 Tax=Haliotis rubra TaxID=36100 RepID=UPI001EE5FE33|nr:uncharacterized protein LOC124255345 [Haliotis rubra]
MRTVDIQFPHLLDPTLDHRVEMFLEKQIGQSVELDFYNQHKMLKSSSVRPSVSDSALLTNGLRIHESVDMYITAARKLDEIRRKKFPFLTTGTAFKCSQNPGKSFSDSDLSLVITSDSSISLQSSSSISVNHGQEQEDLEPQPGPSGCVPEAGSDSSISLQSSSRTMDRNRKTLNHSQDPVVHCVLVQACSACSSTSSLYSTESEVNVFFDDQESILSAVSSVLSLHMDYNQWDWNEKDELVGPLGDDGWAIGSAEVIIDVDDTLEFNMQYPLQPEGERQAPTIPNRTPSESVLCDRKRKYYDEMVSDHPNKRPRASVSDTAISSPPQKQRHHGSPGDI